MSLVTSSIPNLLGGVSRQPAEARYPWQFEEVENWFPSVIDGLKPRPNTDWVGSFTDALGPTTIGPNDFVKLIKNKDAYYILTVGVDGTLRVFGLDGVQRVLTDVVDTATNYLPSAVPKDDIGALTIADTTIVYNKTITVNDGALSQVYDRDASTGGIGTNGVAGVVVKSGEPSTAYTLTITEVNPDGTDGMSKSFTYTTGSSTASIDTIVSNLCTAINGFNWGPYRGYKKAVDARGGIVILDEDGKDIRVTAGDVRDYDGMVGVNRDIAIDIDKLPARWYQGFYVKVKVGPSTSTKTEIWMRSVYNGQDDTEPADGQIVTGPYATPTGPTEVKWIESVNPASLGQFYGYQVPLILQCYGDNDWRITVGNQVFKHRRVGDEKTNKSPSFVGGKINEMVVFRNRLAILSGNHISLSQAGDFYNFYRTSIASVLDEDRIDASASYKDYVELKQAVVLNENLLLISANAQFLLRGGDILTPNNVVCALASNYEINTKCAPSAVGRRVAFTTISGDSVMIRQLVASQTRDNFLLEEIGAHAPGYIPKTVTRLFHAEAYGLSSLYEPNGRTLWINSWIYDDKNSRALQNAFHKWTFGKDILYADQAENYIYLVEADAIIRMDLRSGVKDPGLTCKINLDHRVTAAGVYNAGADTTSFTVPYNPSVGVVVVDAATANPLDIVSSDSTHVVVDGNIANAFIGSTYQSRLKFSRFVMQRKDPTGTLTPLFGGRLQLRHIKVLFSGAGFLRGVVSLPGRDPSILGDAVAQGELADITSLGENPVVTGEIRIPIQGNATTAVVSVVCESYLPCALLSAEWTGYWHERTQRI